MSTSSNVPATMPALPLVKLAERFGESVALTDGKRAVSYTELAAQVSALSQQLLQLDINHLALFGGNSIDWVLIDLACQQAGICLLPLPPFFSVSQINACIEQAGSQVLLSSDDTLPAWLNTESHPLHLSQFDAQHISFNAYRLTAEQAPQLPQGTHKITFTSGSTGHPKGVCLTSEHQWRVAQSLASVTGLQRPQHLCLLPLSTLLENIAGIYSPLLCGGTVHIATEAERGMLGSSRLEAQTLLQCISNTAPNSLILIPQLLMLLVSACKQGWQPPASLEFVAVGGGKVSPQLLTQAHEFGLPVYEGYGLSECGSVVALNTAQDQRSGAAGKVLPHCQVTLEHNELIVSGACHLGYAGMPDSWYPTKVHTGDLATLDNDWLWINGRSKNLLISSFGRNISPEWVESAIMAEPFVQQCMVVGDAQPYLCALMCVAEQVDDPTLANYMARINQQLPDYAQVWHWQRLSLPELQPFTTANGRLKRDAIIAAFHSHISALYHPESVHAVLS